MIRTRPPFHFIKCLSDYISPWGTAPPLGRSKRDYGGANRRSIFPRFIKKRKKCCSEVRHRLIGGECRYGGEQNRFGFWRRKKKRGHGESQSYILIRFFFFLLLHFFETHKLAVWSSGKEYKGYSTADLKVQPPAIFFG